MITAQTIARLTAMAGSDFSWGGKYARPKSDVRAGLFAFLYDYAHGMCVFCETEITREGMEACHIVTAGGTGNNRRGYVAGNIAAGCERCNRSQALKGQEVVPFEEIKRPDLVPAQWPTLVDMRARGKAIIAARRAA